MIYGDYVYLKENEEMPKSYHKAFILNQESEFTITPPLQLIEENGYYRQINLEKHSRTVDELNYPSCC